MTPNDRLRVSVHQLRGHTVVIPIGEIDLETSDQFRASLELCSGDVIIDLAGIPFLDSSGIGVIVAERKRIHTEGGKLHLRMPSDIARRALEAVGLSEWLDD